MSTSAKQYEPSIQCDSPVAELIYWYTASGRREQTPSILADKWWFGPLCVAITWSVSFLLTGLDPATLDWHQFPFALIPGLVVSTLLYFVGQSVYLGDLYKAYTFSADEVVESTPHQETRVMLDEVTAVTVGENPEERFPVIEVKHGKSLTVLEPAEDVREVIQAMLTSLFELDKPSREQILRDWIAANRTAS